MFCACDVTKFPVPSTMTSRITGWFFGRMTGCLVSYDKSSASRRRPSNLGNPSFSNNGENSSKRLSFSLLGKLSICAFRAFWALLSSVLRKIHDLFRNSDGALQFFTKRFIQAVTRTRSVQQEYRLRLRRLVWSTSSVSLVA